MIDCTIVSRVSRLSLEFRWDTCTFCVFCVTIEEKRRDQLVQIHLLGAVDTRCGSSRIRVPPAMEPQSENSSGPHQRGLFVDLEKDK